MMKIMLISNEFPFGNPPRVGGGGSHVFYLAHSLAQLGVEVLILTNEGGRKIRSPLEQCKNIEVIPCNFGRSATNLDKQTIDAGLSLCRKWSPHIIHGHHFQGGLLGRVIAKAYDKPMVLTMHKPPKINIEKFTDNPPKYQRDNSYAIWRDLALDSCIQAHVAYSNIYMKENEEIGVPHEKIKYIPHGVPVKFLQDLCRGSCIPKRFSIMADDILILCPLRPEKPGVRTFIFAASKLLNNSIKHKYDGTHFRFFITGDLKKGRIESRESTKSCYEIAKALGLAKDEKMIFKGNIPLKQMWRLFHRAQVCVIPTYREGFSIAILEAMALGTPIVASESIGISEALIDGVSGLLFNPGDENSLADAIEKVLLNDNLARTLSINALKRVTENFSSEAMAEKHLDLYRNLC